MKLSPAWIALAATAALLTVGCHKAQKMIVPATSTPSPTPTPCPTGVTCPTDTPSPTPAPTSVPTPEWAFGGASDSINVITTGAQTPLVLAAYQGITISNVQLPNAVSGSGSLVLTDALNLADGYGTPDVTPNTLPADDATVGTAPLVYMSFFNNTLVTMDFGAVTPAITVSGAAVGTHTICELDVFSGTAWTSTGASATQSGSSVTIPSAPLAGSATTSFNPGQNIAAIACQ